MPCQTWKKTIAIQFRCIHWIVEQKAPNGRGKLEHRPSALFSGSIDLIHTMKHLSHISKWEFKQYFEHLKSFPNLYLSQHFYSLYFFKTKNIIISVLSHRNSITSLYNHQHMIGRRWPMPLVAPTFGTAWLVDAVRRSGEMWRALSATWWFFGLAQRGTKQIDGHRGISLYIYI